MSTVPFATGVTTPVVAFTIAIEALLELHVPPGSPLLEYVAVCPIQSGEDPLITPEFAFGFTVNKACEDVKETPHVVVTITSYEPASPALTDAIV